MDHDYLDRLKQTHPTLRLLAADNALLFLYRIFIQPNQLSIAQTGLPNWMEDYQIGLSANIPFSRRTPCST